MLATNAILFFIVMWIAYDPSLSNLVIFLCMWIKLNISGTFVVSYLQVKLSILIHTVNSENLTFVHLK